MARAQAIGSRVAAANNHDVFAGGQNVAAPDRAVSLAALILLRQEIHREMDSLQFPARNLQIARCFRASRENDGIEFALQIFNWNATVPREPW